MGTGCPPIHPRRRCSGARCPAGLSVLDIPDGAGENSAYREAGIKQRDSDEEPAGGGREGAAERAAQRRERRAPRSAAVSEPAPPGTKGTANPGQFCCYQEYRFGEQLAVQP